MIKGNYSNGKFKVRFKFQSGNVDSPLLVDTGAVVSAVSIKQLSRILPDYVNSIKVIYEGSNNFINMHTANGQSVKGLPVLFRNVIIGGERIDKFYCVIIDSDRPSFLLGMDFISAGVMKSSKKEYLNIFSFDSKEYESNYCEFYNGCNPIEINELSLSYDKGDMSLLSSLDKLANL